MYVGGGKYQKCDYQHCEGKIFAKKETDGENGHGQIFGRDASSRSERYDQKEAYDVLLNRHKNRISCAHIFRSCRNRKVKYLIFIPSPEKIIGFLSTFPSFSSLPVLCHFTRHFFAHFPVAWEEASYVEKAHQKKPGERGKGQIFRN